MREVLSKITKAPAAKIMQDKHWLVLLVLFILLLRLPSLDLPFTNDGGAQAYHARLIVQGEPLYSTHHTGHHLPAVYYTYALAFWLFGDNTQSVKVMVFFWVLSTTYTIYRLGTLLVSRGTGLLAAIFYAVLTSQRSVMGPTGEIELFANLPRTAAILVLLQLTSAYPVVAHQAKLWWKFALIGGLSALAFLFKPVYLSPLAMAGCVLLVQLWQNRTSPGIWRAFIIRGLWLGAGFLGVLLVVTAYFAWLGLLPRLALVITIGRKYVDLRNTGSSLGYLPLLFPVVALFRANVLLLAFSSVAMVMLILGQGRKPLLLFYILIWYVLSFGESLVTHIYFAHYYLILLPPTALLAAWMVIKVYSSLKRIQPATWPIAEGVLAALLLAALALGIRQEFNHYAKYLRYKLGRGTYEDFVLSGEPVTDRGTLIAEELARYLQERTTPDDYIYYWSSHVEFYYLANRRAPIDIIWPRYAEATGSYRRIFTPQTKYVVLGQVFAGDVGTTPTWLYEEVAKAYTLETIIEAQKIYRRID